MADWGHRELEAYLLLVRMGPLVMVEWCDYRGMVGRNEFYQEEIATQRLMHT